MSYIALRNRKMVFKSDPDYIAALNRIEECFSILNSKTGYNISLESSDPLVFFSGSRTGGYVHPSKYGNRVFLNWVLFKENPDEYFKVVIPHEVAHLFQRKANAFDRSHGPTWQRMMNLIGLPAVRCHKMDTSRASTAGRRKSYEVKCKCKTHLVTANIFNKISMGQVRRCTVCKTQVFTNKQIEMKNLANTVS
jgi:SprT protein